jgi:hypothetical protein
MNSAVMKCLCLVIVCAASASDMPAQVTSPNRQYEFAMKNRADGTAGYVLSSEGKQIWEKAGSARDIVVAAWSPDSKQLLFVEEDRLSLRLVTVTGGRVSSFPVDVKPLIRAGEGLLPYDWRAKGQGSIPHDLIVEIVPLEETTFGGVYLRAKFPEQVAMVFKVVLPKVGDRSARAAFVIGRFVRLRDWSAPIPSYDALSNAASE